MFSSLKEINAFYQKHQAKIQKIESLMSKKLNVPCARLIAKRDGIKVVGFNNDDQHVFSIPLRLQENGSFRVLRH